MSELEQQIGKLTLRKPGEMMDQQVLSLLRSSCDIPVRKSGPGRSISSDGVNASPSPINESIQLRPASRVTIVTGFAAALVIGILIGNGLPSFWSNSEHSTAGDSYSTKENEAVTSKNESEPGFPTRHPMMPELSAHVRDALKNRSAAGSQIVESSYLSAITGAAAWERQNGEIFDVRTHVSDRRFDMCRECHRVGG